jgi:hypothetical protein
MAEAAHDPNIRIEPAWKASIVYGLPCPIYHQLPAAYYLAARFSNDFEAAVFHAINGGGQNMSRACLTGALVGAQVGLSANSRASNQRSAKSRRVSRPGTAAWRAGASWLG